MLFNLWQLPINSYSNRIDISSKSKNKETEKLVDDLKNCFPNVFLEGLRKCVKTKVKFELKENVKPVFKPNRKKFFVALEPVNKELESLEKLGVILKINHSNWASLTVFVKKKKLKNPSLCRFFYWGKWLFKRSFYLHQKIYLPNWMKVRFSHKSIYQTPTSKWKLTSVQKS